MSYQAIPNLIAHEIQTTEGIHLSDTSIKHIERLVMEAIREENKVLLREKEYWMNMYLNKECKFDTKLSHPVFSLTNKT